MTGTPGSGSSGSGSASSSGGTPELDLSPRDLEPRHARRARGPAARRGTAVAVVVVLAAAAGFLIYKMLDEATVYFYTADEAVQQRDALGDDRFRLQGSVVPGTLERGTTLGFLVVSGGVEVQVEHSGPEPDLFGEGTPVVLEGRWEGEVFRSDEILVKHDEVYVEQHEDRLREAGDQVETSPESP